MAKRERERERAPVEKPQRSRAARAALWTAKGAGKLAWGGVKLVARGMWWSAKTGYRVGKRAATRTKHTEDERE